MFGLSREPGRAFFHSLYLNKTIKKWKRFEKSTRFYKIIFKQESPAHKMESGIFMRGHDSAGQESKT